MRTQTVDVAGQGFRVAGPLGAYDEITKICPDLGSFIAALQIGKGIDYQVALRIAEIGLKYAGEPKSVDDAFNAGGIHAMTHLAVATINAMMPEDIPQEPQKKTRESAAKDSD